MKIECGETPEEGQGYFCEVCNGHIPKGHEDMKLKPGCDERHPPLWVPTHKECEFQTCVGMVSERADLQHRLAALEFELRYETDPKEKDYIANDRDHVARELASLPEIES